MSVDIKPTSQISTIVVRDVSVSASIFLTVGGKTIYNGNITAPAIDGVATFYNIRELIEAELEETSKSMAFVSVEAFDETGTSKLRSEFYAVYLKHQFLGPFSAFLKRNFLSTRKSKKLAYNASERLTYIVADGESPSFILRITYVSTSGAVRTGTTTMTDITVSSESGKAICGEYDFDYTIAEFYAGDFADYGGKVLAMSIQLGERYYSIYFMDFPYTMTLMFLNAFNAFETVHIVGKTTVKSKIESSLAVGLNQSYQYDMRFEKTYETETAALTEQELKWFDQILSSRYVRLVDFSNSEENPFADGAILLITDSTCEVDDGDGELQRVKFSWQFTENDPELGIGYVPVSTTDIFTDEYDIIFK